jgi:hypothetical protein
VEQTYVLEKKEENKEEGRQEVHGTQAGGQESQAEEG